MPGHHTHNRHHRPDTTPGAAFDGVPKAGAPTLPRGAGEDNFLDMVVRGADNVAADRPISAVGKDASLWAFDLANPTACNPKR